MSFALGSALLCQGCANSTDDTDDLGVGSTRGVDDSGLSAGGAEPGTSTTQGEQPETTAPVAVGDCVVTEFHRNFNGSDDINYSYMRIRYDRATRTETREYSSAPDFDKLTLKRVTLYDEKGHILAGTGYDSYGWRDDYRYDSAGNEIGWGRTNTDALDVNVPAQPPFSMSADAVHSYDAAGLLAATESTQQYASEPITTNFAYVTDEAGRCAVITSTSSSRPDAVVTEQRSYAADGGVRSEQTTVTPTGNTIVVAELKLDAQGRWSAIEQDGGGHWGASADGTPDLTRTYGYAADGTITVTYLDFTNDVPNDEIERDGVVTPVTRNDFIIAPQCATVMDALPTVMGDACRYPRPNWSDRMTR
jgi:hypothetical protein